MGAWWRCFANGAFLELGSVGSSGCSFCVLFHFISVCVCFLLSYVDSIMLFLYVCVFINLIVGIFMWSFSFL